MMTPEEHIRLALQSVRAMRPSGVVDLDRQELAAEHLRAALRGEAVTIAPAPEGWDRRDYIDTGQMHLIDCPGYARHCDGEKCNRCRHCGWTKGRHANVQALRDCPGFLSSGTVRCTTCGYVENVHRPREG